MNKLKEFAFKYFVDDELQIESRILNFVCTFGVLTNIAALITRLSAGFPFITAVPIILFLAVNTVALLASVKRARYAEVLTTFSVFFISIVFWPALTEIKKGMYQSYG